MHARPPADSPVHHVSVCRSALGVVLAACLTAGAAQGAQRADVLIRHATLVDVGNARLIADQAVVTRDGSVMAVGPDGALSKSWRAARVIDATGRFLIPGLWDMHVHFGGGPDLVAENRALLPLYIAHGVTTVRDCSGDLPAQVLAWRTEIATGSLLGPQLFSSGAKLEGIHPVWKGTIEVGSEADVDAALDREQRERVDFVKITDNTLDPKLFLYAVAQAHARGLRTSGHIPLALTVDQAVEAGISSIEHLDYAYQAGVKDEAAIAADFAAGRIDRREASRRIDAGFDPQTARREYRTLAERHVFVTPTLNISRTIAWLDTESHADDAYLQYIGPKLRKTYDWRIQRAAKATPAEVADRHAHFGRLAAILPLLQQAGVTIMAGTDAGFLNSFDYPGIGLHDEIAQYVEHGLSAPQALASATLAGPAWFGLAERYGDVAPGKAADLVLLDANPLIDIRATRAIRLVMLRGAVFDRAALDGLLATARAQVKTWNAAEGAGPPAQ